MPSQLQHTGTLPLSYHPNAHHSNTRQTGIQHPHHLPVFSGVALRGTFTILSPHALGESVDSIHVLQG